jgi:hypothetical protein
MDSFNKSVIKMFPKGSKRFFEYFGLRTVGFTDKKSIRKIMKADTNMIFAELMINNGELVNDKSFMTFSTIMYTLSEFYPDRKRVKLVKEYLLKMDSIIPSEIVFYMSWVNCDEKLIDTLVKRVLRHGFTKDNYTKLRKMYLSVE